MLNIKLLCAENMELWVPPAPGLQVQSYIVIDVDTNQILAKKNIYLDLPPSSLSNLLLLYDIADKESQNLIQWDQLLSIPTSLPKVNASMHLRVADKVPVIDLVRGLLISANDAVYSLQKVLYKNSEDDLKAQMDFLELSMNDTISASTLAKLSVKLLNKFPDINFLYSEKYFQYRNVLIENVLINIDPCVQGIMTSYEKNIGHSAVVYTTQNNHNLIIIIMNARTAFMRDQSVHMLLKYSYRFYKQIDITENLDIPKILPVKNSREIYVQVQSLSNVKITVPSSLQNWTKRVVWKPISAPIALHDVLGHIEIIDKNNELLYSYPILAESSAGKTNCFKQLMHYIKVTYFLGYWNE